LCPGREDVAGRGVDLRSSSGLDMSDVAVCWATHRQYRDMLSKAVMYIIMYLGLAMVLLVLDVGWVDLSRHRCHKLRLQQEIAGSGRWCQRS